MDTRESDETKEILNLFLKAEEEMLLVGDIVVDNSLCIEHKTINDFISSVFDSRLFNQISKMQANYSYSYILVSGSITNLLYLAEDKNCYNAIIAAIGSCFARKCPVIFCDDLPIMCEIIKNLSEKLFDGKNRSISVIAIPIEHAQLRLLCSINGISEIKGQALLDRFDSPFNVFNATTDELKEVKGIGEKIAIHIKEVIN